MSRHILPTVLIALTCALPLRADQVVFDNLADGLNTGSYAQVVDWWEYFEAACSFTSSTDGYLAAVDLAMTNNNPGPGDGIVSVYTDSGGAPGSLIESASVAGVPGAIDIYQLPFGRSNILDAGSTYWVVLNSTAYTPGFNWYSANTPSDGSQYRYRFSSTGARNVPVNDELGFRVTLDAIDVRDGSGSGGGTPTGDSQADPILPTGIDPDGTFRFEDVPSGKWFDPPLAEGFIYTMTGEALFTGIAGLPDLDGELDDLFTVAAEGSTLGAYGPGDTVDFVSLLGHGVSEFVVTGIDPAVDAAAPDCFPLAIEFDTATADFVMQPIPEPASVALLAFGGVVLLRRRR